MKLLFRVFARAVRTFVCGRALTHARRNASGLYSRQHVQHEVLVFLVQGYYSSGKGIAYAYYLGFRVQGPLLYQEWRQRVANDRPDSQLLAAQDFVGINHLVVPRL